MPKLTEISIFGLLEGNTGLHFPDLSFQKLDLMRLQQSLFVGRETYDLLALA
ncbi:MAG: hypothetical protein QNJ72_21530 [Pleurocapsa sp. MO_226.B13]|nr:hypothetical protein [Pleurocapsa sp. MO_226.B13]